jgi:APA family basic amino acid/polyamine antiporter
MTSSLQINDSPPLAAGRFNHTGVDLQRRVGLFPAANIVIANMIGAGIFTTSGLIMAELKNPLLMLVLWAAGAVIALCGALCYGELGAAMPEAGGEYYFLSRLYHPLAGFLSGWVSFVVGFSAPIAASSIGFSEYFLRAFPVLSEFAGSQALVKKLLSLSVIALFTGIHIRGVERGLKVQNALTLLKVGLIAGLILLGVFSGKGDFRHFSSGNGWSGGLAGFKTAGLSLMWILFAYSGWNASTYIGSEIRNPERNLPLSLLAGTGVVAALYLCLNALYVYAVPPESMQGVVSVGGLAAGMLFGRLAEVLFSLLIAFALFSSLSAFMILGPRVYYSMARDGCFFKVFSNVHPDLKIPRKAIVLQGLFSGCMVLSGTFDQILTYMGFSLGLFPIFTVFGMFKLRRLGRRGYRAPGHPLIELFYLLPCILVLILAFMERPVSSSIALLTVTAGVPVYYLFFRSQKAGPASPGPADIKRNP